MTWLIGTLDLTQPQRQAEGGQHASDTEANATSCRLQRHEAHHITVGRRQALGTREFVSGLPGAIKGSRQNCAAERRDAASIGKTDRFPKVGDSSKRPADAWSILFRDCRRDLRVAIDVIHKSLRIDGRTRTATNEFDHRAKPIRPFEVEDRSTGIVIEWEQRSRRDRGSNSCQHNISVRVIKIDGPNRSGKPVSDRIVVGCSLTEDCGSLSQSGCTRLSHVTDGTPQHVSRVRVIVRVSHRDLGNRCLDRNRSCRNRLDHRLQADDEHTAIGHR